MIKTQKKRKISSNSVVVNNDHGEVGRRRVERMGGGVGGEECYKGFPFRRD